MGPNAKTSETRLLQAVAFAIGAVALYLLVERGKIKFYWTPLIIGLSYLGAAMVGGRKGGHWPTALVLVGWGGVVAWSARTGPELDTAGLYLAGGGLGVLVAGILLRAGFKIDVIGLGGTAVAAGLVLAFSGKVDYFVQGGFFAILLVIVAAVNVALALAVRGKSATA